MFEKVNPSHPDKIADRIAGAIVDLAYAKDENPKIAVEVLVGHGECNITIETGTQLDEGDISAIVRRLVGATDINLNIAPQDVHLADNQSEDVKCGDNGIFRGMPIQKEEKYLTSFVKNLYNKFPTDGKFILTDDKIICCQSCADNMDIDEEIEESFFNSGYHFKSIVINPLGSWTGGVNVDTGATNRKLGSDMGSAVTGGGLHGKDLSKADVSVNIYAFLKAQELGEPVELFCAIGDGTIDGKPYSEIVDIARKYINELGGFEKFAEYGLIR